MPRDVLVTQYRPQVAGDLVRWIDEAASRDQHDCSQWTCDADHC